MTQVTVEEAMRIAIEHHQGGRWTEAVGIYRQVLAQAPNHADAWHLLGALACQRGRNDLAIDLIGRAIAINPTVAGYHGNLGESYRRAGRWEEAIASLRRAIQLNPDFTDAHANLGLALQAMGRHDEAIEAFGRAIALRPGFAEAHTNLGNSLIDAGRPDAAIDAFGRAIALRPEFAEAYCNLGNALKRTGRLEDAIDSYRRAIQLKPDYAKAHNNLGSALRQEGRLDETIDAYRRAIAIQPDYATAHYNLGNALSSANRLDEAIDAYRRVIALRPDDAEVHNSLGSALWSRGRLDAAIATLGRATALRPDYAEAHSNLGNALKDAWRYEEAIAAYRRAIELQPDNPATFNNLGVALSDLGRLDEAIDALEQAVQLAPEFAEAHSNLGSIFKEQGRLDDALAVCRKAVGLKPNLPTAASNLLCILHYHPSYDAQAILAEHRNWAGQFAEPLPAQIRPHRNGRERTRRLKLGFVSPDFRAHPVGHSLLTLLAHLDRQQFEVVLYSDVKHSDDVTGQLRALTDTWRDIAGLGDTEVADRVRDDRIDLLVDLALHTAGNRMPVFARKPAPVQVTMLGMPATTGLATIDYRLTDAYLDPPGVGDENYAERSIRMPNSFWCYQPPAGTPPIARPPALENGYITFGCLNNFTKVSQPALELWLNILQAVPDSRLLIQAQPGRYCDVIRRLFEVAGIADERVAFVAKVSALKYFARYHEVDLSLDPFPYNGHTSALDSLWMGVPVVTLVGRTAVGRAGVSILSNLGLPELIAHDPQRYMEIAVDWAGDRGRLDAIRAGLRERLRRSPLMDGAGYAADVGAAFHRMWETWCGQ